MCNLSEEEIIKNIKEMIQWSDHSTYKMALQGLLDLYQAEKEKNKHIAYDIENFKRESYLLGVKNENEAMKGVIERHYISKDKIKEEIEELDNMKVEGEVFTTSVNFAKKILEELLKGE